MLDRDVRQLFDRLGKRRSIARDAVDDLEVCGIPGDDEYISYGARIPVFSPIVVRRPFPLKYVELNVVLQNNQSVGFALYQATNRNPSGALTTTATGLANNSTVEGIQLRRIDQMPPRSYTRTPTDMTQPDRVGQLTIGSVILYPDVWYYLGVCTTHDTGAVESTPGFYGVQMAAHLDYCFLANAAFATVNDWPAVIPGNWSSSKIAPIACALYTRRGMLRYRGT